MDQAELVKLGEELQEAVKKQNASLEFTKLTSEQVVSISKKIPPHFGKFHFTPPPSYEFFLTHFGAFTLKGFDSIEFSLLTPTQIAHDTKELVHVPENVQWEYEDGTPGVITTNHLIAFAADDFESRWCFYTDSENPDGELSIYLHHQDNPFAAKDINNGNWVNVGAKKPDFENFTSWLKFAVHNYSKGQHWSSGGFIVRE